MIYAKGDVSIKTDIITSLYARYRFTLVIATNYSMGTNWRGPIVGAGQTFSIHCKASTRLRSVYYKECAHMFAIAWPYWSITN